MDTYYSRPPKPAYTPLPPTHHPLYDRVAATHSTPTRRLLATHTIPPRSGLAFRCPATSVFRLSTPAGPQVGDLNVWAAAQPRAERFWAARTRQLQGAGVSTYDRLWSNLPWLRPLCGVVRDGCEVPAGRRAEGGGEGEEEGGRVRTRWGGRCHDLLGTRCDPYVNALLASHRPRPRADSSPAPPPRIPDHHCHSNLVRAALPFGLFEPDVHDVLNVFQVAGLDARGRYFMERSPATADSFLEFFAEMDLVVGLSTCPGGDLGSWGWGGGEEGKGAGEVADAEGERERERERERMMRESCREIRVEVWELVGEERARVLEGWEPPRPPVYTGMHGIKVPLCGDEGAE